METKEHRTEPMACPQCGYEVDTFNGVDHKEPPAPGSLTICLKCVTPAMLDGEPLSMRPLTFEEWDSIHKITEVAYARILSLRVRLYPDDNSGKQ